MAFMMEVKILLFLLTRVTAFFLLFSTVKGANKCCFC